MLVTLVILQIIITQLLSQTHQQIMAQLNLPIHGFPANSNGYLIACIDGRCKDNTTEFSLTPLFISPQRQFFSAKMNICENSGCYQFEHIISTNSAILKEGQDFSPDYKIHAVGTYQ